MSRSVLKSVRVHGSGAEEGEERKRRRVVVVAAAAAFPQPIFSFSSINPLHVFLLQRPSTPPLAGWGGDVGLPSTRGECHVKQTPHEQPVSQANLWNRKRV